MMREVREKNKYDLIVNVLEVVAVVFGGCGVVFGLGYKGHTI